jgi:hypothetical protein
LPQTAVYESTAAAEQTPQRDAWWSFWAWMAAGRLRVNHAWLGHLGWHCTELPSRHGQNCVHAVHEGELARLQFCSHLAYSAADVVHFAEGLRVALGVVLEAVQLLHRASRPELAHRELEEHYLHLAPCWSLH